MRLYVAGPMTGRPHHGFPDFDRAARQLRARGHDVVSPHELSLDRAEAAGYATRVPGGRLLDDENVHEHLSAIPWEHHLREDLKEMLSCDGVVVLDGWTASRGAVLEVSTAYRVGLPVYRQAPGAPGGVDPVNEGALARAIGEAAEPPPDLHGPDPSPSVSTQRTIPGTSLPAVEVVEDGRTGAVKADGGKPRTDLMPPAPLLDIADVFRFGADKYADRNWERGFDWSRLYGSAMRHLLQWWGGQDNDPETGMSHLAHLGCNVLMLLEYQHSQAGRDDRPYREGDHE